MSSMPQASRVGSRASSSSFSLVRPQGRRISRRIGLGYKLAVDGRAAREQRRDLLGRDAGFLEDRDAVLADARRVPADRQSRSVPPAGDAGIADPSFGRVLLGLEEIDRREMRIVD